MSRNSDIIFEIFEFRKVVKQHSSHEVIDPAMVTVSLGICQ